MIVKIHREEDGDKKVVETFMYNVCIINDHVNIFLQMPPLTDASYETLLKYLSKDATKEVHHVTGERDVVLIQKTQNMVPE